MSNFALVSALIRGDWAIEEQFALNSLELVERILDGSFTMLEVESPAPSYSESHQASKGKGPAGGKVMILPMTGVLMKNDGACGSIGMASMANYIKQANQDPNISGIVLAIDSPGGSVDGTEMLARAVKSSAKPVVSWVDGMAASAALWIASAAREIMASSGNDQVGSVGAMIRLMDTQPKMEKEGVRFHTIISDQTPDKNKHSLEIQQGKYDNFKADHLNPLAQNFIDAVQANRPGIDESYLTGKMYFAKNAMGSFVDRIGSLEDAISRVQEMETQPAHSNTIISMTQFERINAALNVEQLESVDGNVSLNAGGHSRGKFG
jgi:protease-4